jgi:N-acyl-D-amino-acid deacylase
MSNRIRSRLAVAALALVIVAPLAAAEFDVVLRGGTVYDGSGRPPVVADVALRGDRIAAVGDLGWARGERELDVSGLAVAPGFVNMLSWAVESLIVDRRSLSDVRQGVTLEVFGEGWSMGPLNSEMKAYAESQQTSFKYAIEWTTLGEYLEWLERRGVAPNVASFVGATTVRIHELGYANRPPTAEELERMRALVRSAMEEGALGVGSSLIYAPAFYAATDELVELVRAAAPYGGMYVSHLRSEGNRVLEAVDELIEIARLSGAPAEIYHLKLAGRDNWEKLYPVIDRVERARAEGLRVTADMYVYPAGATGLDAAMPPWVQEGGFERWRERLQDPEIRARVVAEMTTPTDAWENLFLAAGAEGVKLLYFKSPELRGYTGRTLAEVAAERGTSPAETAIDLVVADRSRVEVAYFLMDETNIERQIALPWMSFGSDADSQAPEGTFLEGMPHPRAYGNFARLLGHYVRDRGLIPLAEAIRRLTSLPCENLKIRDRGRLEPGMHADLAIFDPAAIRDHATFDQPQRFSSGMVHVFVNGEAVLRDGEPTGATPGRVVRGPGWTGLGEGTAAPSEQSGEESGAGFEEAGREGTGGEAGAVDLARAREVALEDRGELVGSGGAVDRRGDLEVQAEAAVVEVAAADDGELAVDDHRLGVQHRRAVLPDARAGEQQAVEVRPRGGGDEARIAALGHQQADVDAAVGGRAQGGEHRFVGNEIGRRHPHPVVGAGDGGEEELVDRIDLAIGPRAQDLQAVRPRRRGGEIGEVDRRRADGESPVLEERPLQGARRVAA